MAVNTNFGWPMHAIMTTIVVITVLLGLFIITTIQGPISTTALNSSQQQALDQLQTGGYPPLWLELVITLAAGVIILIIYILQRVGLMPGTESPRKNGSK